MRRILPPVCADRNATRRPGPCPDASNRPTYYNM